MARNENDVTGNQVDPKWASQFEHFANTLVTSLETRMNKAPVVQIAREPEPLTTEEEAKKYDQMIERDFMKMDPKTKKVGKDRTLFKPIHIFPQWQSANPNEFVAWFVIENYKWVQEVDDTKKRQVITSFNVRCKDFVANYKPTVIEAIPELEEESA